MKTPLIAGNSRKRQSAAKLRNEKVQRLSRKGVHSSEWKWGVPRQGKDIVSSVWKHTAVHKRTV